MIKRLRSAALPRLPDLSDLLARLHPKTLPHERRAAAMTVAAFVLAALLSLLSAMGGGPRCRIPCGKRGRDRAG